MAPTRSCLACRRRGDKRSLVRLAVVDGKVVVDKQARKPGRGAYLCHRRACMALALSRGGAPLVRALRLPAGGVDTEGLEQAWRTAVPKVPAER
ncbi:MAG: YlxR family protein [Euzebyales bacterium]|nr:YlxR family protein [Euzebyales bacterium]